MRAALAMFAKAPHAGQVKTRLAPCLSPAQAAGFHRACVRDTWSRLQALIPTDLFLYANTETPELASLAGSALRLQSGGSLGERMLNCFQDLQTCGYEGMMIVGSDSPTLPLDYLRDGLDWLANCDVVIGPAEDGGYYAIGSRAAHQGMFEAVAWSSPRTLEQTERNVSGLALRLRRLPPWYDIDTISDLRRLAVETNLPANVAAWIEMHSSLLLG